MARLFPLSKRSWVLPIPVHSILLHGNLGLFRLFSKMYWRLRLAWERLGEDFMVQIEQMIDGAFSKLLILMILEGLLANK